MLRRPSFSLALLCLTVVPALLVLPGCADEERVETKAATDYFTVRLGERTVRIQIAVLQNEQQHGLMGRTALGADEGMLFVYREPQQMSFWMRNTLIPLDIGYFDSAGELREVWQMYPHNEHSVRSRGVDLQYALEMNRNWYRTNGVGVGARLDLAAVKAALEARGFSARKFGFR